MAIASERNATKMYSDLAKKYENQEIGKNLAKIAEIEAKHVDLFVAMRRELPESMRTAVFSPDNKAAMYLQTISITNINEGSSEAISEMAEKKTISEILDMAIELEKEAILFYLGIKDAVPERLGKDMVDRIIKEEQNHVVMLSNCCQKNG
jgi:rubrerythrin